MKGRSALAVLVLALAQSASAQMSEQEFWRRVLGFDLSALDDFKSNVQAQAAQIDALRRDLQRCGNCSDRARLNNEVERRDVELRRTLGPMCVSIQAFSGIGFDMPNGVEALTNITGVGPLCRQIGARLYREAKEQTEARYRADYEAKARSGRPEDIFMLGNYYAKLEDRVALACPYWLLAARKGHAQAAAAATSRSECAAAAKALGVEAPPPRADASTPPAGPTSGRCRSLRQMRETMERTMKGRSTPSTDRWLEQNARELAAANCGSVR
jgi:hypothetical protein